jgi:hypothetical protein
MEATPGSSRWVHSRPGQPTGSKRATTRKKATSGTKASLQVSLYDVNQLVGRNDLGARFRSENMSPHVILEHFGHKAVHRTTGGCDELKNDSASGFPFQGPLHGFDLSPQPSHPIEELRLLRSRVAHVADLW